MFFKNSFQKSLVFLHGFKARGDIPNSFANKFTYPSNRYPTNFSKNNFALPKYLRHKSKYKISITGPLLWSKFLSNTEKELQEPSLLKAKLKSKLLNVDDEVTNF